MSQPLLQRILITNDDGIDAEGIAHLQALAGELAGEVYVVAPNQDCSGQAQSLSLHTPLRVTEHGDRRFSVNGTPADCVLLGLNSLLPGPVDVVLSGINRGANVGDAVGFSGTLGAAKVAAQFGVPAIGLSQAFKRADQIYWSTAKTYAASIIRELLALKWQKAPCVNINFPAIPPQQVQGVDWCEGSEGSIKRVATDCRRDPRNRAYYWLEFEHDYRPITAETSDISTMRKHHIAVQSLNQPNPYPAGTRVVPAFNTTNTETPYD